MAEQSDSTDKFEQLRRQAEILVRDHPDKAFQHPPDILHLIHELNIHQTELEIQNEELRRTQEALSDLYREYEELYEFAPCGYITLNAKGIIKRSNLTAVRLLGKERTFLQRIGFSRFIANDWDTQFQTVLKKAGESREGQTFEFPLKNGNNRPVWVRAYIAADVDEFGAVVLWRIALVDISKGRQAVEALKRIEWLLTKDPSFITDSKYCQPAYGDLTALNTDGEILLSVDRRILDEISSDYLSLLENSSAIYEKDGQYALGIFSSGWCRFLDEASRRLCQTTDNTEALQSGRWLCHESCWTDAAKTAIETGKTVDTECHGGLRIYATPIFAGEDIVGAINAGYGDPPQRSEDLIAIAEKYHVSVQQLTEIAKEYESRPHFIIEIAKDRLKTSARLIGEMVQRKRSEEQIRQYSDQMEEMVKERTAELEKAQAELLVKERLAVLGHFSGSISHEIRNPLGTIGTSVYLLKMKMGDQNEILTKHLDMIQSNVNKADAIIGSLLSLTRMEKPKREKHSLKELISEVLGNANLPASVEIVRDFPETDIIVNADADQIRMALKNIFRNAKQAMDGTGKLTITMRKTENEELQLMISDTGPGISAEDLENVFVPLFTTKTHGIGFGLSITRMIIESHGGTIRAESVPGNGAKFIIVLPTE